MNKERYEKRRTRYCLAGVVLFSIGRWPMIVQRVITSDVWLIMLCLSMAGTALLIYGCYCWAKHKGRSGKLSLLGLLGLIGFLILSRLKDKWIEVS